MSHFGLEDESIHLSLRPDGPETKWDFFFSDIQPVFDPRWVFSLIYQWRRPFGLVQLRGQRSTQRDSVSLCGPESIFHNSQLNVSYENTGTPPKK